MRRHNTESDLNYIRRMVSVIRSFTGNDKDLEYDLLSSFEDKEDFDFSNMEDEDTERVIH